MTGVEAQAPIPPFALIARFCARGPQRNDKHDALVSLGFCGYAGGRGDLMATGFDDGYTFMGYLGERGWHDLPRKGNWPYVIYMRWPASDGEPETIIEYCEADLTVWQFATHEAASKFYASLKDAP